MRTPKHWTDINPISNLLWPLGKIYAWLTNLRLKHGTCNQTSIPVICIGNLTAGGTGKTPTAISIAKILQKDGMNPYFISRGYGGKLQDVMVNPNHHNAKDVGDEPLLLSKVAPVCINSNRYLAAEKARNNEADIIIMDDGYQNPSLHKDISFIVIDGGFGLGNFRPIPSGPLRENFSTGLKRADAVIIIGEDQHNIQAKLGNLPIFHGDITPLVPSTVPNKVIAFAGIGRPEKFYQSLQKIGFTLEATIDFPDHHFYTESELRALILQGEQSSARLFTTSKDMVKIPKHLQNNFEVLEINIQWHDEAALQEFIKNKLQKLSF